MILVEVYVISMNEYVDILLDEELLVGQAMEQRSSVSFSSPIEVFNFCPRS